MKFRFEGREYVLEFQREIKDIATHSGEIVRTRHPRTTVMVVLVDPTKERSSEWTVAYQASAGVAKGDKFDFETGRQAALKRLMLVINDEKLKGLIWEAYLNRPHQRLKTLAQAKRLIKELKGKIQNARRGTAFWQAKHAELASKYQEAQNQITKLLREEGE